jgi:hypothetical protein
MTVASGKAGKKEDIKRDSRSAFGRSWPLLPERGLDEPIRARKRLVWITLGCGVIRRPLVIYRTFCSSRRRMSLRSSWLCTTVLRLLAGCCRHRTPPTCVARVSADAGDIVQGATTSALSLAFDHGVADGIYSPECAMTLLANVFRSAVGKTSLT